MFVGCRSLIVGHWMLTVGCCFMVAAAAGGGDDFFWVNWRPTSDD